ncbi:hypothetical protein PIB30_048232 [Stylosanthes scabra]|uniref:Uncharacterized protein n=1 Tax=Stylosanthes scabra TaxID=79078 RepID=A0ABU6WGP2_9FABA|nr:hypothetical protein [Stylosanthes scabra]
MVRVKAEIHVKLIIERIYGQYGYNVGYKKAWMEKQMSIISQIKSCANLDLINLFLGLHSHVGCTQGAHPTRDTTRDTFDIYIRLHAVVDLVEQLHILSSAPPLGFILDSVPHTTTDNLETLEEHNRTLHHQFSQPVPPT